MWSAPRNEITIHRQIWTSNTKVVPSLKTPGTTGTMVRNRWEMVVGHPMIIFGPVPPAAPPELMVFDLTHIWESAWPGLQEHPREPEKAGL